MDLVPHLHVVLNIKQQPENDDLDVGDNTANLGKEEKEKEENANSGGLDDDSGDSFILVSSDKQQFELDRKSAKLCKFIQVILQGDENAKIIDTPQVIGDILKVVVEYLKQHAGAEPDPLPMPVRSTQMKDVTPFPWDGEWIDKFTPADVFEIILAANYLDVKSLLHLGCAKIATEIKKLPREEINKIIAEEEKYRKEQEKNRDYNQEAKTDEPKDE